MTSMLSAFPLMLPETTAATDTDAYHGLLQCDGGPTFRIRVECTRGGAHSATTILPAVPLPSQHAYKNLLAEATARAAAKAAAEATTPRHLLLQAEPALAELLSGYAQMIRQVCEQRTTWGDQLLAGTFFSCVAHLALSLCPLCCVVSLTRLSFVRLSLPVLSPALESELRSSLVPHRAAGDRGETHHTLAR